MAKGKKLGLGTAQFGMRYGLTKANQVSERQVHRILDIAAEKGVHILDTAAAYGNSEAVIGRYPDVAKRFAVVTKTLPIDAEAIVPAHISQAERRLGRSLKALRSQSVYCVLAHRAQNLLAPGGGLLISAMERWKAEGRVEKVGVSAYDKAEIDAVMNRWRPDVVQVPVNLLDQRLIKDGTLQRLADAGIEVHARSVFLQGVLLTEPALLPRYFDPIKPHLQAYRTWLAEHQASPISAALSFVEAQDSVGTALVGVQSVQQLNECLRAITKRPDIEYGQFALNEERFVDPRRWGEVTGAA